MSTVGPVCRRWFFPHSRISQVPPEQVRDGLTGVFERWGQPGAMRVDNGEPLGSPSGYAPPPLSLWLIAQGVKMIWNQPGAPKQNAKVEKLQDTTSRWAEVEKARDIVDLQQKLDDKIAVQREHYPVSRLGGKTRLQAFPALLTSQRPYRPNDFNVERVWAFFHSCVYTRKVSSAGVVTHFNQQISIGLPYKGLWAQVRLAKEGQSWEVLVEDKVVKTYAATNLSKEHIASLTVFQKTNPSKQTCVRLGGLT